MQTCKSCGIKKNLSEYYRAKENSLGVKKTCKACQLSILRDKRRSNKKDSNGNICIPELKELKELVEYNKDGSLTVKYQAGGNLKNRKTFGVDNGSGYRVISIKGVRYKFHRIVWKLAYGTEPEYIDHINHDRSDNRIENLRFATREENSRHQVVPKNNTTGFIGVHRHYKSWIAVVVKNSERTLCGRFENIKDAVLAYNEKCNELHGEFGKSKIIHNMEELKRRGLI